MHKKTQAIIFDMDGVISKTQHFHSDTESKLVNELGITMTSQEIINTYAGTPDTQTFKYILEKHGVAGDVHELVRRKWKIIQKKSKNNIHEIPGVTNIIKKLYENNYHLAVASASPTAFIKTVLHALDIEKYFSATASGDEITKGKPSPEIFLLAAKRLKKNPQNCLVIEDARNGVLAAKAAGMKCIAITTTHNKNDLQDADKIIDSFGELSVDVIGSL